MDKYGIEATLSYGSETEKIELLSHLCDVFESYNKNIKGFDEIVQMLVNLTVKPDDRISDDIIDTILTAQINQDISNINFDIVDEHLETAPTHILPRFIEILSYTYNRKYIPSIVRFKDHKDAYIKQAVEDAIIELGGL